MGQAMPVVSPAAALKGGAMRLFLYGTLLDPARLAACAGPGLRPAATVLTGYRRVGLRFTPYPTLRKAWRGRVEGAVVEVDAAGLRRLMAYEGPRYRLMRVAVRRIRGNNAGIANTGAFVWIAAAATGRPWP